MIRCIVIDDQQSAVEIIANHISKRTDLQLVNTFMDPREALQFLETEQVGIVFTDMEMPYMSGIELMENLKLKRQAAFPKFVFITGHRDYALTCYETGARDYLLKPVGLKRFNDSVDRLMTDGFAPVSNEKRKPFFFADVDGSKVKINFQDIVYIEGSGNYLKIVGNRNKVITYCSLHAIQQILPAEDFLRVHKSFIVGINFIESYKGGELKFSVNDAPVKIPTGITFRDTLLKRLEIK